MREEIITWAPAAAKASAMARPIPRDAPVTSALRPASGPLAGPLPAGSTGPCSLAPSRYFASSRRATVRRCTSSGPSAIRSARTLVYIRASGKSLLTPAAPCACTARSITRLATSRAATLIPATSVRAALLPWLSISQAALSTSSRAWSISIRLRAIHSRTTPWSASGPPNATRDVTLRHISSRARSAIPTARIAWCTRPGPSRAWAMAKPLPLAPSRLAAGTRTPVSCTSPWPIRSV